MKVIDLTEQLKLKILKHLHALEEELSRYLPDIMDDKKINLARNPFTSQFDISKIADDLQDELLEMRNDSFGYNLLLEKPLSQFWVSKQRSYVKIRLTTSDGLTKRGTRCKKIKGVII